MAKIKDNQDAIVLNAELHFISGLKLRIQNGACVDINISGTHQRIANAWKVVSAKISYYGEYIIAEFFKPVNFFQIKIDLYGIQFLDLQVEYIKPRVLDENEALALMKTRTITFVGCARNCEEKIPQTMQLARKLGGYFKEYAVIVFENDSTDKTREKLRESAEEGLVEVIERENLDTVMPFRTQRLSYARNLLLDKVRNRKSDLFCVMDMDGIIGDDFSVNGFISNFTLFDCWDAVFPANASRYYDVWALRHDEICPNDYERRMNLMNPALDNKTIFDACLNGIQAIDFRTMTGWLPVASAFGGLGIYKTEAFANSNYFGVKDGYEICEHVPFHERAGELGARLYINPMFIVNSNQ